MSRLTALSQAKTYDNIRRKKVRDELGKLAKDVTLGMERTKRAVHFWHGVEGVQWFMSKAPIDPGVLDAEFEKEGLPTFLESEETHELTRQLQAKADTFMQEVRQLLTDRGLV